MTDDLLKRASSALREETRAADDGARFTRARVLASLQQSQVRRRSRLAVLLPLAACFAAASAFGMASGRVPALVQSVTHALGFQAAPTPVAAPARRNPPSTSPAPVAIPTPTPTAELAPIATPPESPAPAEVPTVSEPSRAPTRAPERAFHPKQRVTALAASAALKSEPAESAPPAAPSPAVQGDVSDRAHELYRVAHRTHFVDHDYVSALRAWDAYLEAAPNGRFVLEARYNRALCLVRVGRSSEAREALAPFASGKFGGYRQEEARALIDAIGN